MFVLLLLVMLSFNSCRGGRRCYVRTLDALKFVVFLDTVVLIPLGTPDVTVNVCWAYDSGQ